MQSPNQKTSCIEAYLSVELGGVHVEQRRRHVIHISLTPRATAATTFLLGVAIPAIDGKMRGAIELGSRHGKMRGAIGIGSHHGWSVPYSQAGGFSPSGSVRENA